MNRGNYQSRRVEAVENCFAKRPEACLAVEDVYRLLQEEQVQLGKTTVYRAIARLCEEGVLRRYASGEHDGAALYQYTPCAHAHLHIRCLKCGKIGHLDCDEVESFTAHLQGEHGFRLDDGQSMLYGVCKECASHE